MTSRVTRREALVVVAGASAGFGALAQELAGLPTGPAGQPSLVALAQEATPVSPDGEMVGQAEMPRWIFTVLMFQDPYEGVLTRPAEPEPGVRYIAAEVRIENQSDQPLEFAASDIRLRDEQGTEYASSSAVVGAEPKLTGQKLPDGERTRGWVWFAVPDNAGCSRHHHNCACSSPADPRRGSLASRAAAFPTCPHLLRMGCIARVDASNTPSCD
jgi:hypothetical protein